MKEKIRVLQLIDSLSVGGAERMAINIANDLAEKIEFSAICASRAEGDLKVFIKPNVDYLFLNKSKTFDLKTLLKLRKYVKKNDIQLIHAHSTSILMSVLLKFIYPIKIIWHDHFGNAEYIDRRPYYTFKILSFFISNLFCVNDLLLHWAINKLEVPAEKCMYLANYASLEKSKKDQVVGVANDTDIIKMVNVANLRPAKNHFMLFEAIKKLKSDNIHLYLVGRDFNDEYSKSIKLKIEQDPLLKQKVTYLGARTDISDILQKVDIGILASDSEGLPVSLLEYGLAHLAVVCTNVGQCAEVLDNPNFIVEAGNAEQMANTLDHLIKNTDKREEWSNQFNTRVFEVYSKNRAIQKIVEVYKKIC